MVSQLALDAGSRVSCDDPALTHLFEAVATARLQGEWGFNNPKVESEVDQRKVR